MKSEDTSKMLRGYRCGVDSGDLSINPQVKMVQTTRAYKPLIEKMTRFEETCELETDRFSLALIWKKGD